MPKKVPFYNIDKDSIAFYEIVAWFRHLTKSAILQPLLTQKIFKTSNSFPVNDRPGYNIYVFVIRYCQEFSFSQLIKARFAFKPAVDAATNRTRYALLPPKNIII